jgi:hypothetical protein
MMIKINLENFLIKLIKNYKIKISTQINKILIDNSTVIKKLV